jgi:hypothetical protein
MHEFALAFAAASLISISWVKAAGFHVLPDARLWRDLKTDQDGAPRRTPLRN